MKQLSQHLRKSWLRSKSLRQARFLASSCGAFPEESQIHVREMLHQVTQRTTELWQLIEDKPQAHQTRKLLTHYLLRHLLDLQQALDELQGCSEPLRVRVHAASLELEECVRQLYRLTCHTDLTSGHKSELDHRRFP